MGFGAKAGWSKIYLVANNFVYRLWGGGGKVTNSQTIPNPTYTTVVS